MNNTGDAHLFCLVDSPSTSSNQKQVSLQEEEISELYLAPYHSPTSELDPPQKMHCQEKTVPNLGSSKWQFLLCPAIKRCRLISIIVIAYYFALYVEGLDPATWHTFSFLSSKDETLQQEAMSYLNKHTKVFSQIIPSQFIDSPHFKEILPYLNGQRISYIDYSGTFEFDCQVYVFHAYSGTLLASYPETYDSTKRQLFFSALRDDDENFTNIGIINNLLAFFRAFGVFCFFCKKFFRGHGTQHKCPWAKCCFACRRPFLTSTTYVTSKTANLFCNTSLSPQVAKECKKCNMRLFTAECEKHHKAKVCRWGILCPSCNSYMFANKFTPKANLLKGHICGLHQCFLCGVSEPKGMHVCKIRLPSFDKEYTNLGFLNLEFSGPSPTYCQDCFLENNVCTFCKDNVKKEIVVGTLLLETEKRGTFRTHQFSLFPYMMPDTSIDIPYLPESLKNMPAASRSKTKFGQAKKKILATDIFEGKVMSVLDKFFDFISKQCVTNTTFILNDESQNSFEAIIKTLYRKGVHPIVIGHPQIYLIEIPSLDIRFINLLNYIDAPFCDLKRKFFKGFLFFPQRWIKDAFFFYNGTPPKLTDFFDFEDSKFEIESKKQYISTIVSPWNFQRELVYFCQKKCIVIAEAAVEFLKTTFLCQSKVQVCLTPKIKSNEIPFVHPFNKPLFTKASFAYKLMCLYCKDMQNVRTIKPPVHMQSSHGELEFCFYTKWLNPDLNVVTAWSPRGQKRFPESFPDYYIPEKKICGYWNGCLVHGHPRKECLKTIAEDSKKNMFQVSFEEAFENYTRKKKKLLENQADNVKEIDEMWQCIWEQKKKTDPKLKKFLATIYRNPPIYRLQVHAAGEQGW